MKATLYAIRINQAWSWQASLNDKVDQAFWVHRNEGKPMLELLRLYPLISWGQALWLQHWMNQRSQQMKDTKLTDVRGELIKALKVIQATPELLQKLELRLWDVQKLDQPMQKAKSLKWVGAMQGRALLPNEWIDLRNEVERAAQPLSINEGTDELQEASLKAQVGLFQGVTFFEAPIVMEGKL